jgi:hypothetical protein
MVALNLPHVIGFLRGPGLFSRVPEFFCRPGNGDECAVERSLQISKPFNE